MRKRRQAGRTPYASRGFLHTLGKTVQTVFRWRAPFTRLKPGANASLPTSCRGGGQTFRLIFPALLAFASIATSQETKPATNAPTRRGERPPLLVSPELLPNGGVTFRFKTAKATEVKVSGQFGPDAGMTRDDKDVWSVTVPSVPAGVHEYHFVVDGLNVIDPQNSAIKPQRWPGSSILHIPSTPPAPWDLQDIPHGTLHEHTYKSRALDKWRRIFVYTPPGAASAGRLPVALVTISGASIATRQSPWLYGASSATISSSVRTVLT